MLANADTGTDADTGADDAGADAPTPAPERTHVRDGFLYGLGFALASIAVATLGALFWSAVRGKPSAPWSGK